MPFNLSGLGEILSKEAGELLPKALDALRSPAIPEVAARGTAEAPEIAARAAARGKPVRKFAPSVSSQGLEEKYRINPAIEEAVSQTHDPKLPFEDKIQKWKATILSAFDPAPNMPRDIKENFLNARSSLQGSRDRAARDIVDQLESIKDDKSAAFKATMIMRQMKIADTVRHMEDNGLNSYGGHTFADWKDSNEKLLTWIKSDPALTKAHGNLRDGLDDIFNDMVDRGWIVPDRYLEQWTPMRKINTVFNALGDMSGTGADSLKSRILSSMKHRPTGDDFAIDEGNMLHVLHEARTEYYKKVAEHELFLKIINDPTLNMTTRYKAGETLPRDLAVYMPGKGMVGSTHISREGQFLGEALREIDPAGTVHAGGWVLPRALVDELNNFHPMSHHPLEKQVAEGGRKMAKFLTVYNPANTMVNFFSDGLLAMMGLPGEKARPMGFLRWYGEGVGAAKAFTEGRDYFVTIGKQKVNVTKLLNESNIKESTLSEDLSGRKINPELQQFLPKEELGKQGFQNILSKGLETFRERVELQPRIAAGLAALEETGDIKEFGRIAKQITLNFGAGSPKLAKVPLMRFMSPFITFQGLATERMARLITTEGSRGRTLAILAAVPASVALWNSQNEEFKKINESLPTHDKTSLHFIVGAGDGHALRDTDGNPVIIRLRYFVPEDVMRMIGLGNIVERGMRLAQGRDTLADFAKDTISSPVNTVKESLVIPNLASELLGGKSSLTGKPLEGSDWVTRLAPGLRMPFAIAKEAADHGLDANRVLVTGVREFTGARPMTTYTTMGHSFDADLREALQAQRDALRNVKLAARKDGITNKKNAIRKYKEAIAKLKRIAAIIEAKEGRDAANNAIASADKDVGEWDKDLLEAYQMTQSEEMRKALQEEGME